MAVLMQQVLPSLPRSQICFEIADRVPVVLAVEAACSKLVENRRLLLLLHAS